MRRGEARQGKTRRGQEKTRARGKETSEVKHRRIAWVGGRKEGEGRERGRG